MRGKTGWITAGIVLIILIVGGFALFRTKPKTSPTLSHDISQPPATGTSVVMTKSSTSVGQYLTDGNGRTLYTYSKDSSGVSNCSGSCLSSWPPYQAVGTIVNLPENVGTIRRTDNGEVQFTYKGLPLYYFVSDAMAGQITGNGLAGFSVARP